MLKKFCRQPCGESPSLCQQAKELIGRLAYDECADVLSKAMQAHPHAAEPHNLFGILLEKRGDHVAAMKHFRAAWALEPTYLPARYNLDLYGTLCVHGSCAYTEADCPKKDSLYTYTLEKDGYGVEHVVKRGKNK